MGLFSDQITQEAPPAAAAVPQLPRQVQHSYPTYQASKSSLPMKKPWLMIPDDDDNEYFTVPDLGWDQNFYYMLPYMDSKSAVAREHETYSRWSTKELGMYSVLGQTWTD